MAADGFIEKLRHFDIGRLERIMKDHQSLAGGVALAQSGHMTFGRVGILAIAVDDERIRGGGLRGIRRPADADLGGDAKAAGIEVFRQQLAAARVFVLAGAMAFRSGDEQHRLFGRSERREQQGGQQEAYGEWQDHVFQS